MAFPTLPPGATMIWVEVTDNNGCSNTDTVFVEAYQNEQVVELVQGWSIMSTFIDPFNPSIDSVFAPVESDVLLIKNGGGSVYWP